MPDEQPSKVNLALEALTFFISKFSPAAKIEEAEFLYSTNEIVKAVKEHTGNDLASSEIYDMMTKMAYVYDTTNDLEFVWLLKKADG